MYTGLYKGHTIQTKEDSMEARSLGNMNKQETGKKMETVKKSEH